MAEIDGPGAIQQIWMTPAPIDKTRQFILRFYWDGEDEPSVEVPMGDFFACGWGKYCQINSLPVCVNPGSAFNCYWSMPFRKKAKVTMENLDSKDMTLYYQINYTLTEVPEDAAYFHAQFRRVPKLAPKTMYTILDGVQGKGHYVGTYLAWEVTSPGWWGEGEIKFYMDGDSEFPTICGTGTEDYFCGSYNFENQETHKYQTFSTPYTGLAQVLPPEIIYKPGQRFGLYRWHIADPVRFEKELKVAIQALGWQEGRALPAAGRRHRLGRLLVPARAARQVSAAAAQRRPGRQTHLDRHHDGIREELSIGGGHGRPGPRQRRHESGDCHRAACSATLRDAYLAAVEAQGRGVSSRVAGKHCCFPGNEAPRPEAEVSGRHPEGTAWQGSPRWGRGCEPDRAFSRSLGGGHSELTLRSPWP